MRRLIAIACLLALVPATTVFAQRGMGRDGRNVPRAEPGAGKRQKEKRGKDTPIERWNRMTPEERRRALEKLPPERRRDIEQKLQRFRNLPSQERQQLRDRYQAFSRLPPEEQNRARVLFRQFNSLPPDRRPVVRQEFEALRSMPESERRTRLNSSEFRTRFTASEQVMLQDLAQVFGSTP